jgi:hypothetical protein
LEENANEMFKLPLQNGFYNKKVQMSRHIVNLHKNRIGELCRKENRNKNVQNYAQIVQIQKTVLTVE